MENTYFEEKQASHILLDSHTASKHWVLQCPAPAWNTAAAQEKVPFPNPSRPEGKAGFTELPDCQPAAGHEIWGLAAHPFSAARSCHVCSLPCAAQAPSKSVRPGTPAELRTHDLPVASPEGDFTTLCATGESPGCCCLAEEGSVEAAEAPG